MLQWVVAKEAISPLILFTIKELLYFGVFQKSAARGPLSVTYHSPLPPVCYLKLYNVERGNLFAPCLNKLFLEETFKFLFLSHFSIAMKYI